MLKPHELKAHLPIRLSNGVLSTTANVWEILAASREGDLQAVRRLVHGCPELIYAQYNYTPPIHFAVREGHRDLVAYLLDNGAHDPDYRIYPFRESLQTIAQDRGHVEIAAMLNDYAADGARCKFRGDNGEILYSRTKEQNEFEKAVDEGDLQVTERLLKRYPEFALDQTYFWGEGILTFAAKENNRAMVDLLIRYGAVVPAVLKWAQFYYFERLDGAAYMMEKGMNPNTMSWQRVALLHDMAQKGDIAKAELLVKYGAGIDPVEEEYRSTPLGMAVRWGHEEMVEYLLAQGADASKAGASWATPLAWAKKKGNSKIEELLREAGAT